MLCQYLSAQFAVTNHGRQIFVLPLDLLTRSRQGRQSVQFVGYFRSSVVFLCLGGGENDWLCAEVWLTSSALR